MNKIWYLSTCDTCTRIIKELNLKNKNFKFQDIKIKNISENKLDEISKVTGLNYSELFNKRAQKYTKTKLKKNLLNQEDFKKAILEEYTFLKRPIIFIDKEYFIGNNKKVIEYIKKKLE